MTVSSRLWSNDAARFPVPFGGWPSLLGTSCPAEAIGVPCGRLTLERTATGFPRSALVRYDRVGRSLYSGVAVSVSMAEMHPAP